MAASQHSKKTKQPAPHNVVAKPKAISNCPHIRAVVKKAVDSGKWEIQVANCKKHRKLVHLESSRTVSVAVSPSCTRSAKNLQTDINHIERGINLWGMSSK